MALGYEKKLRDSALSYQHIAEKSSQKNVVSDDTDKSIER